MSEWIDGTLDEPQAVAVRAHLDDCVDCRAEEQRLALLHTELTRALAVERDRAGVIADRVLQELPVSTAGATPGGASTGNTRGRWLPGTAMGYLISAAAGFLIAAVWFRLPEPAGEGIASAPPAQETSVLPDGVPPEIAVTPAAHLVHATGNVSFRPPTEDVWTSISRASIPIFSCPSDGSVRTEPGALCELETSTGSLVRLNESSEVKVLADDELQLVRGQVWCRASSQTPLKVVTTGIGHSEQAPADQWTLTCRTNTESFTSSTPTVPLQVVAAAGTVDVRRNGTQRTLPPGTFFTLTDGEVKLAPSSRDMLTEERWMQPLLTLSGHGNPELTRRVDALLAQIGRTKLSNLYEQDLRSLGEYGALPLLKFTAAQESAEEPSRRRLAMNIVADTAPIWMVPDLIGLLEDDDPDVRRHAARGLARLTGETQELSPDDWKAGKEVWADGLTRWQDWWQKHRSVVPVPPASVWNITP